LAIATDLQNNLSPHRRLFLKVDGHKEVWWQHVDVPGADGQPVGDGPPGAHPITDDCVALWRCDEWAATDNLADATGRGRTGAQSGSPPTTAGKLGRARGCNASDWFAVTDHASLHLQRFTICGWVYCNDATQNNGATIFLKDHATHLGGHSVQLYTNSTGNTLGVSIGLTDTTNASVFATALSATVWHHFAATWDGTTLSLYIDGVLSGSTATAAGKTIDYDTSSAIIGNDVAVATTYFWDGYFDDIAIYSVARSAEWVRRQYNHGNDYRRPGINCLIPPASEYTAEIDLGTLDTTASMMTFELINYADKYTTSFYPLSQLFAPGRWESDDARVVYLTRKELTDTQVDADATTFHVTDDLGSWSSSGEAYVGQETFSYTSVTTALAAGAWTETVSRFNGVTKGLYPCVGSTYGRTYELPKVDGTSQHQNTTALAVSTVPFSWVGRRVALYLTCWDVANRKWYDEDDAVLLWCGTINGEITFDARRNVWQLSCEHIGALLDQRIGGAYNRESQLTYLNLQGNIPSRSWWATESDGSTPVAYGSFTLAQNVYASAGAVLYLMLAEMNDATNWTNYAPATKTHAADGLTYRGTIEDGTVRIWAESIDGSGENIGKQAIIYMHRLRTACMPWIALGFAGEMRSTVDTWRLWDNARGKKIETISDSMIRIQAENANNYTGFKAPMPVANAFHPLHHDENGSKLYALNAENIFVADQGGDYTEARAFLSVDDYGVYAIKALGEGSTVDEITLSPYQVEGIERARGRALSQRGGTPLRVKQVYVIERPLAGSSTLHTQTGRGPLYSLLPLLLSTGTDGYNDATLDTAPVGVGLAMQSDLVDITAIEEFDAVIVSQHPELAERAFVVLHSPPTWRELWLGEAQMFGVALVWSGGKFKPKWMFSPDHDVWTETLDSTTCVSEDERPRVVTSPKTAINQVDYYVQYDSASDDWGPPISIVDQNSISGMGGIVKAVEIRNRGIKWFTDSTMLQAKLLELFLQSVNARRFPWQVVTVSLAPSMIDRVYPGDIVTYTSSYHPDPYGDGGMTSSVLALVIDTGWNYAEWKGRATLLLYSRYDAGQIKPWAGAALVDISASNGGWNAGTYELTLDADEYAGSNTTAHDGVRFGAGDTIQIIERAPSNPTAAQRWTATVDSAGYTPATRILALTTVTLTGWDADVEYIVVPQDYSNATSDQRGENAYQADTVTRRLNPASLDDRPHRWG